MYFPSRFACLVSFLILILCLPVTVEAYSRFTETCLEDKQNPEFECLITIPNLRDTLTHPFSSDSLTLDEIIIRSTRLREPLHYQPVDVQLIDSLRLSMYRSMPVSSVLSRYSSLFIRDNGPGGAATLSQRGLSPDQTQVLWEGFPLNSHSLGLADLSVIPSELFSSVEVSPGTPSSAFGGGSLGGTVYLSSQQNRRQNHIDLSQSAGAFQSRDSRLKAIFETGNWNGSLQALYHTAENDFGYYNRATGRSEKRTNNTGQAGHLMGNISYRLAQSRIYSGFWYYNSLEEIPGSILSGNSEAEQFNKGLRWFGAITLTAAGWNIDARSYLERDHFGYEDPPVSIDSRFTQGRWLTSLDFIRTSTGRLVWQGGLSGGLERVGTNNYSGIKERWLMGIRINPEIRISNERLRFTPALRLDGYTDYGWVISPSLGANWEVVKQRLYLRGMVSRDFNPPSFNDLYWVPGGNSELVPERSFKTESGFIYSPEADLFDSFSFTGYRIWLEEGIYWFPDNEGIWTPSNIEEVDAYGMEARLDASRQVRSAEFLWSFGVDWRKSEIAAPRFPGDQAAGRQMRYVPEWSVRSDLGIRVTPVTFHLNYRWTDRRFTTADHTSSLDGFRLLDLTAVIEQELAGVNWHVRFSANNLLDEQYEIIQWYPMPGRHFEFSIGMKLPL